MHNIEGIAEIADIELPKNVFMITYPKVVYSN